MSHAEEGAGKCKVMFWCWVDKAPMPSSAQMPGSPAHCCRKCSSAYADICSSDIRHGQMFATHVPYSLPGHPTLGPLEERTGLLFWSSWTCVQPPHDPLTFSLP